MVLIMRNRINWISDEGEMARELARPSLSGTEAHVMDANFRNFLAAEGNTACSVCLAHELQVYVFPQDSGSCRCI